MVLGPSVFSFTAAHGVAPLGDAESARQSVVAAMIKSWSPKAIFFGGDNVWPTVDDSTSAIAWDFWLDEIADEIVFPAMGIIEHHAGYPLRELDTFQYLPDPQLYYKLVFPLVTFFVIDTERYSNDEGVIPQPEALSDQARWLYNELDQSLTKWNVVIQYGAGWTSSHEWAPGKEDGQWSSSHPKVDVVLCGQGEVYERFAISGRPPIINVGIGGQELQEFATVITAGSVVRANDKYGALRLSVTDTELDLSAFCATSELPFIFDRLTLRKDSSTTERVRSVPATP